MKVQTVPPRYLAIAQDIAARIAKGDLQTGKRLYGRSVMASEYNVSPETIRRALRLLADMKVIEVKPQCGVVILSQDNARRYIEQFAESDQERSLKHQLKELMTEYGKMNQQLTEIVGTILKSRYTFAAAEAPIPNYEVKVPDDSPLIGKSIGELKFWQATGGTIIGIRRGQTVLLSPGPYAELYAGDVILLVGTPSAAEAADLFVRRKE